VKDFLGRGIGFPLEVDGYGRLRMSSHERSVEESIRLILGTAPGERMMRPEFGCRIHEYVFHPASPNTSAAIVLAVRNALRKWEPRIENVDVTAYPDPQNESTIQIAITYAVRRTNSIKNLVYPFFLRRDQDL
jgi:phage baseplate assembly protein W